MNSEFDRIEQFRRYLIKQIDVRYVRPYSEKEDIERTLYIYEEISRKYDSIFPTDECSVRIDDTDLSIRALTGLRNLKITNLSQLTEMKEEELSQIRNLGERALCKR